MLFRQRWRGAVSFVGLGVKATARQTDATTPQITSGAGAPGAVLPDGSVYLQTDAGDASDALHMMIGGLWVPFDGNP